MRTFREDYAKGLANEKKCLDYLNYYFEEDFMKTPLTHPFDFVSTQRFVELKSRTCSKTSYPSTMVGYDKIRHAKLCDRPVHFAFLFRDGSLWEIEYDEVLFETFLREEFQRDDRTDHRDIRKMYCYIPTSLLKSIGTL